MTLHLRKLQLKEIRNNLLPKLLGPRFDQEDLQMSVEAYDTSKISQRDALNARPNSKERTSPVTTPTPIPMAKIFNQNL